MSDTNVAEVAPVTSAPKAAKPAKASKGKTKPAPKKTESKKETNPGLRKPQIRILAALSKGKPMTRAMIAEKSPVDVASCVEYLGSHDPDVRKANDTKHFPSLITLGLVKFANGEEFGGVTYEISAKGRDAYAKIK